MKSFLALVTFSLIGAFSLAQDKKAEKYESKDGGYKIAFPGKPKESESKQETKVGDIKTLSAVWKSADDTQHLSVAVTKLPFAKDKYDPKKGLDGMAKPVAGFKNITVKEIEFGKDKLPGRDIVSENEQKKLYSRAKLVFNPANMSMYQVTVIGGSKEFVNGKDVDAFLASFELAGK